MVAEGIDGYLFRSAELSDERIWEVARAFGNYAQSKRGLARFGRTCSAVSQGAWGPDL